MLHTSLKDLELAENVIDKMVKAKKFPEFYETWQYYLYRCERAWEQARKELATGDYIEVDVSVNINEGSLSEVLKNFTILQSGGSRKLEIWHTTPSIPRQDIDELDLSGMSSEEILDIAEEYCDELDSVFSLAWDYGEGYEESIVRIQEYFTINTDAGMSSLFMFFEEALVQSGLNLINGEPVSIECSEMFAAELVKLLEPDDELQSGFELPINNETWVLNNENVFKPRSNN